MNLHFINVWNFNEILVLNIQFQNLLTRAERDRANIYSELQQTRAAVEQVGREKVQWILV